MNDIEIMNWIKSIFKADYYYAGTLDGRKNKAVAVYTIPTLWNPPFKGAGNTQSHTSSIVIHWTSSTRETQTAALQLYKAVETAENVTIDGHKVDYIQMKYGEPIFTGQDDNGIMESVVEFVLWYEKE